MTVPFVDLAAQSAEIMDEVGPAGLDLLARGAFIGGPPVRQFEEAYAEYAGVAHCVGVGNGTDALTLALRAAGVRAGDEVILPANTFIATAEAISQVGAVPVPVDVDVDHLLIDPNAVAAAVTERTRAIMPVHLFGQTAPVPDLVPIAEAAGAVIIEDAAQSQGASRGGRRAGTWGLAAGTSFYPGKNLGAAGDAGAVLTDDPEVADRVRVLADHGSPRKYVHEVVGTNSRLDALQAIVLRAKLRRLEGWNEARRRAAGRYDELLADVEGVRVPQRHPDNVDVWHLYVVQVDDRDRVLTGLQERGIGAGVHYPTPVHLTPAFQHLGLPPGTCPVAEAAAGRILSLPMFPHLTADQQVVVVEALTAALDGGRVVEAAAP
ncbi:DegT/DnrJ/EryC1/StrS family aminotransferase [Ornithinimicrobium pekingense]|uniref:Glutamine--scyllo-inositol aminotransferase n=1 Tax=Ornithinimicrobium pekingense TaxID=384677 RepID=A0ABQ2FBG8_9MICO|nr:DegT/DnrJ/EryC1/StrS family aminotransferase [Ornithinimicrobium pekingense]GGK71282.1 glutamine--scyllo-inositol aminotransferase [Ornithinimicrobium pekingense]